MDGRIVHDLRCRVPCIDGVAKGSTGGCTERYLPLAMETARSQGLVGRAATGCAMNDPGERDTFVAGDRPVNLRRQPARPSGPGPSTRAQPTLSARMQALQARREIGAPLATSAAGPAVARRSVSLVPGAIAGFALAGAATAGLLASTALALGCLAVAGATGAWWIRSRRGRAPIESAFVGTVSGLDPDALRAFDASVEAIAPELPQDLLDDLRALKSVIAEIIGTLEQASSEEPLPTEDIFHLRQCIGRYIPDLLHGYLRVPRKSRDQEPLSGGQAANQVLKTQLASLRQDLGARQRRLAKAAGESLLRQQRFLNAKLGAARPSDSDP